MHHSEDINEFGGGEVQFWIADAGSIHLKAISPNGDPTELTADEARQIAAALLRAANEPDEADPSKQR
jgi:hypothetical protein